MSGAPQSRLNSKGYFGAASVANHDPLRFESGCDRIGCQGRNSGNEIIHFFFASLEALRFYFLFIPMIPAAIVCHSFTPCVSLY